ncbi:MULTISPECIES: N-acetylmuramoyl-L-alanine amidase [Streptomyces]|uniref:N-acetylmuramoyl-L-alanine amidase n=1 Tax=unclassified Streptomyces TaxID=2593676 RepID=UPI001F326D4D|nr:MULTISPECIES: N-acetylmuramoyl-L-alanine amidase [Streptomyces]
MLVPACVVGGLVWQSLGGDGARGGDGGPSSAGSRGTAEPGGPADGADGRPPGSAPPSGEPDAGKPLAGKVVVVDPGHNPGNRDHPREINASVDIGTNSKACDTTGTATNDGYAEAEFTLDVARRIRTILEKQGAEVRLTHDDDRPYGPCVDERAAIGNKADADAAVSVHADGSGAGNRGFHVILPGAVKEGGADTRAIVGPSRELGERIAGRFVRETGSEPSNYIGGGTGLDVRSDLGGLNLSEVPKVFVECGNMRDPQDAERLTSAEWRQSAARGIADGIALHLGAAAGKDF